MGIKTRVYEGLHWVFQNVFWHWSKWWPEPLGLLPVIIHRDVLVANNLLPLPELPAPRDGETTPINPPKYRPHDGYGTDVNNPWTSSAGAPVGRNMPPVPVELRLNGANGDPDVQLVAQRLLARDGFKPAGDQLNIMAAAWIQTMVHDWIGHKDDPSATGGVELSKGKESGCPMHSFKFRKTLERPDGNYDNFRTMWWDASFLYGNDEATIKRARTMSGGKLKVNPTHPNTLPMSEDKNNNGEGVHLTGDNKNSWVGVSLLQELFLKEHNAVVEEVARNQAPGDEPLSDDELFGIGRNVVAALVAKIHTIDWTIELLKTRTLDIGMKTNWVGLPKALGINLKFLPPLFKLTEKKKADNKGVPFCLTEEFAAVYRLHPLLPPGLVVGPNRNEFIPLEDLVGAEGRKTIRRPAAAGVPPTGAPASSTPPAAADRALEFWDSALFYPCGGLVPHNYPTALRDLAPTDEEGRSMPDRVDLAALDLHRDRERGILRFNAFRRALKLKPYKTWTALTGEKKGGGGGLKKNAGAPLAAELEAIYGPAPEGIERCDLLVGDMFENKLRGFAISETSFIVFLLMASRRLDADPFLNEYYNEATYTKTGLDWIEGVDGLKDLLKRHYPSLADNIPQGHSAFKPYGTTEEALGAWGKATAEGVIPAGVQEVWEEVKAKNAEELGHGGANTAEGSPALL